MGTLKNELPVFSTLLSLFITFAISVYPAQTEAQSSGTRYRCSGRTQDRPCSVRIGDGSMAFFQLGPAASSPRPGGRAQYSSARAYARVVSQSFEPTPRTRRGQTRDGHWYGVLEGNGSIEVFLEFSRGKTVLERRFMGKIALKNKKTTYSFISAMPAQSGWQWRIIAEAT